MAQLDREVLFESERFVIGVLQVVSAGSVVAALGQAQTVAKLVGQTPFRLFVTGMVAALILAVLAAFYRHYYKMWDVKGSDAKKAKYYLNATRRCVRNSLLLECGAFVLLVGAMWWG